MNKSLKRLTSSVILGAILLWSFSANALAASGYADSKTTAVELNESYTAGSYLDYQDTDWYKYTNNSGRTIEISFSCDPMVDFINYDIKGHYPNGDIRTAPDNGSGNEDIIYDVILQPGEVF